MANKERTRWGSKCIVPIAVESATVINKGDHVAVDGNYAVPFNLMNDPGDAAANREAAADHFWGIAQAASAAGETDPINVDISNESVYDFELQTAATLSFGAQLEPYSDGGACNAQQVVAGTTSQIAATVETITSGTTVKGVMLQQKFKAEQG